MCRLLGVPRSTYYARAERISAGPDGRRTDPPAAEDEAAVDERDPPEAHPIGLAQGTELIGRYAGSGYREPPHLLARGDGQIVRVPELLYQVAGALTAPMRPAPTPTGNDRRLAHVADAVSTSSGRGFSAGHVAYVLDQKLAPLGVSTYANGRPPARQAKSTPFLALRFRFPLLPPKATAAISGIFRWLFLPPVLLVVAAAGAAADVWAFRTGDLSAALAQTLVHPSGILVVVGLAIASTFFHEIGHAAACRYSGAEPGAIGCGLYLVWPAFYTDITNTYRLGRAGRLRTDFGGVYFNAIFIIGLAVGYAQTGYPPLLVAVLATNLELVQQLLPTLRFDGYYIVADLVGVPDLFRYIGPILRRALLRRPADARLTLLKRWPQRVIAGWVLLVGPVLGAQLAYLFFEAPRLVRSDERSISALVSQAEYGGNALLSWLSAFVQIALLVLPLAGLLLLAVQLARGLARAGLRRTRARAGG